MNEQVHEGTDVPFVSMLICKKGWRALGSAKFRRVAEHISTKLEAGETIELPAMAESILRQPLERMRKRCILCGSEGGSKYHCGGGCNVLLERASGGTLEGPQGILQANFGVKSCWEHGHCRKNL